MAFLNMYPAPNAVGQRNAVITSPNPQDQRKDNIRFDYRLNEKNNFAYRYTRYNWVAVDAFRDNLPFARTDWERPNYTSTASWTSTLTSNLINELTYTYSKDNVFINVFTENGAHERSRYGINYPYIFQEKEIVDKIPTVTFSGGFQTIDGGPYPASSAGPIHTVSNTTTLVRGRHTFKAGVSVDYSGEDDFDQINVSPSRAARTTRTAGSSSSTTAPAAPASASPTQRWACSATTASSASATSPGGARWRPMYSSRIRGSRRAR